VVFSRICPERSILQHYNRRKKMRKFWVVLLTMGLIMAFAMPVSAVDVKFSGQYYVVGYHGENWSASDKDDIPARNLYAQRLRMQTVFQVAEGLSLTTRIDALEKRWGERNWTGGTCDSTSRQHLSRHAQADVDLLIYGSSG
jgi:hypothetical protein